MVLWFGLYMITLNWGEREVDAGTAAMLVNVGPILIALLGGWLLDEGLPRRLGAGMAVSFAGVVVVGISESGGAHASVIGVVLCLPFAGQLVSQLGSAPVGVTLNVVYLGLFPTALGFTTWAYALARTTSGKMGATTYAVPALVVVMSWLILGQVPGWLAIGGGALCLAGVAVSRSRSDRGASRQPAVPAGTQVTLRTHAQFRQLSVVSSRAEPAAKP